LVSEIHEIFVGYVQRVQQLWPYRPEDCADRRRPTKDLVDGHSIRQLRNVFPDLCLASSNRAVSAILAVGSVNQAMVKVTRKCEEDERRSRRRNNQIQNKDCEDARIVRL
jgi:hypothetical protein